MSAEKIDKEQYHWSSLRREFADQKKRVFFGKYQGGSCYEPTVMHDWCFILLVFILSDVACVE